MGHKYSIVERQSGDHGGLYELERDTFFDVVELGTGKTIMTFQGEYSASFGGHGQWGEGSYSGVKKVELSPDESFVLVFSEGKSEPERIALP